jgi:hypothetical protein
MHIAEIGRLFDASGAQWAQPLASSIPARQRATRSSGSWQSVGRSTTRADTRLVHGSSSWPVRMDAGTIARSGRSGSASWANRYSRSAPAQTAMTMSLTVPPVASLRRLMFGRDAVRMAKRRWPVIVLFHGAGGANVTGSGRFGLSPLPSRTMALMPVPATAAASSALLMPVASAN